MPTLRILFFLLFTTVIGVEAYYSKLWLRSTTTEFQVDVAQPPLYLPEAKYVRIVSLGYENIASHLIWFNTQNYFGKHLASDKDYRWLESMCKLVTELNPNAHYAFEFCGTMLVWSAGDPEASNEILTAAISAHSDKWLYSYLRGFNYFYFLNNKKLAQADLEHAATLPGAPVQMLYSIIARLMVAQDDPIAAITFLTQMIRSTNNTTVRQVLIERRKQAYHSRNVKFLNGGVALFIQKKGRPPLNISELTQAEIINKIPNDPFGGVYYYDSDEQTIKTTSNAQELIFAPNLKNRDKFLGTAANKHQKGDS